MSLSKLLVCTVIGLALPVAAFAAPDDTSTFQNRMDRLEKKIEILQKEAYGDPNDDPALAPPKTSNPATAASAKMDVRFAEFEERLRKLQGRIEEVNHENDKLKQELKKLSEDHDYRLTQLEQRPVAAPAPAPVVDDVQKEDAPTAEEPADTKKDEKKSAEKSADESKVEKKDEKKAEEKKAEDKPKAEFASAREHYNHAFKLLNDAKYDDANKSFTSFLKTYPDDALTGNVYYWLGETAYVKGKHEKAVDYFRQGFESKPEGPKAGDNLLKMAMSLSALKRTDEACVVLQQIRKKYGDTASMKDKAAKEQSRIGCKE